MQFVGGYLRVTTEAVVETAKKVGRSLSKSRAGNSEARSRSRSRDGRAEAPPSQSRHSRAEAGSSSQSQDGIAETRSLSLSGRDVKGACLNAISSAIGSDSVAECLLDFIPIPGITLAWKGLVIIFDAAAALHYNKQLALELSNHMRKIVVAINDELLNDQYYADSIEKVKDDLEESRDDIIKFLAELRTHKQKSRQPAVQKPDPQKADPVIFDLPSVPRELHRQYEKLLILLVDIQETLLQIQRQGVIDQIIQYNLNKQQLGKLLDRIDTDMNLVMFGTIKSVADKQGAIQKDLEILTAATTLLQINITEVLKIARKSAEDMSGLPEAVKQMDTASRQMQDAVSDLRSDILPHLQTQIRSELPSLLRLELRSELPSLLRSELHSVLHSELRPEFLSTLHSEQ
ncbi:hypothetical protein HDU93_002172 [Gonapodya sp. JEL0774]|nr:hypothetical protein HDU93_002172 [Gonapodya sp. JEL0774]